MKWWAKRPARYPLPTIFFLPNQRKTLSKIHNKLPRLIKGTTKLDNRFNLTEPARTHLKEALRVTQAHRCSKPRKNEEESQVGSERKRNLWRQWKRRKREGSASKQKERSSRIDLGVFYLKTLTSPCPRVLHRPLPVKGSSLARASNLKCLRSQEKASSDRCLLRLASRRKSQRAQSRGNLCHCRRLKNSKKIT